MEINLPSEILPFKRRAWKPLVEERDGSIFASKFSGAPYLEKGEDHPLCGNCQKPMQLFVQLNLDELPEALKGEFGSGLAQLFYCISDDPQCEVECDAFFPFSKSVLARLVQPEGDSSAAKEMLPENSFPPKLITGWKELEDYPNWEEGESLGIELAEEDWDTLGEEGFPQTGDKLAGYPAWIQGIEYPDCPVCGETMRLLFQLDSNDNLPFMFGDVGCGHLTQCKNHKDQLAFGWACG